MLAPRRIQATGASVPRQRSQAIPRQSGDVHVERRNRAALSDQFLRAQPDAVAGEAVLLPARDGRAISKMAL